MTTELAVTRIQDACREARILANEIESRYPVGSWQRDAAMAAWWAILAVDDSEKESMLDMDLDSARERLTAAIAKRKEKAS
jgi:hypothetical protein